MPEPDDDAPPFTDSEKRRIARFADMCLDWLYANNPPCTYLVDLCMDLREAGCEEDLIDEVILLLHVTGPVEMWTTHDDETMIGIVFRQAPPPPPGPPLGQFPGHPPGLPPPAFGHPTAPPFGHPHGPPLGPPLVGGSLPPGPAFGPPVPPPLVAPGTLPAVHQPAVQPSPSTVASNVSNSNP